MIKQNKARYIELSNTKTATGQSQYSFPDISELRGAQITGIESYDINDVPLTLAGNTPVATSDFKKSYLTLYFEGGEFVVIPLVKLVNVRDNVTSSTNHPFSQIPFMLNNKVIDWTKSYITIPNLSGLTTDRVFHFNIYYQQ